jgi:CopG family transcriptional regulator, nickel-responsive regulator
MNHDETLARISISLPDSLLAELDRRIIAKGYASRSELVRDLIRKRLVEDRWARGDQEVVGVLTISYDHHQHGLTERITDLQHHCFVNVLCSTHVHLDPQHCLETIIVRGRPTEIEQLIQAISGLRGVRFAKLTRAAIMEQ